MKQKGAGQYRISSSQALVRLPRTDPGSNGLYLKKGGESSVIELSWRQLDDVPPAPPAGHPRFGAVLNAT